MAHEIMETVSGKWKHSETTSLRDKEFTIKLVENTIHLSYPDPLHKSDFTLIFWFKSFEQRIISGPNKSDCHSPVSVKTMLNGESIKTEEHAKFTMFTDCGHRFFKIMFADPFMGYTTKEIVLPKYPTQNAMQKIIEQMKKCAKGPKYKNGPAEVVERTIFAHKKPTTAIIAQQLSMTK